MSNKILALIFSATVLYAQFGGPFDGVVKTSGGTAATDYGGNMYQDTDPQAAVTVVSSGVWVQVTGSGGDATIFTSSHLDGVTVANDLFTVTNSGEYKACWNLSGSAALGSSVNYVVGVWVDDDGGADVDAGEVRSCSKRDRDVSSTLTGNWGDTCCRVTVAAGDEVGLALLANA